MSAIRASRGTLFILLQNAVQFGIGLLFYTIAAKILATAEIGLISTFTFISVLFMSFAPLSLQVAATRYVAESMSKNNREEASSIVKTVRKWVFLVSLGFLAVGSVISFLFPTIAPVNPYLTLWVLVYSFFLTMRITYQAFLQGLQMFERYALIGVVSLALTRGLGILMMILGYGLLGIIFSWALGEAAAFLIAFLFYRRLLPETKTSYDHKSLFSFSLPILFMTVANTFSEWIDRLILRTLTSDLEKLGVYELAIRGSSTLALIWVAMSTALLPTFSESYGQSGDRDMTRLCKLSIKYMAYFIAPASFGLAAISKSIMALLFGWEYTAGSIPLAILAIFSILASFSIIASTALQALGRTMVFLKITLTTIIADFAVSVVLIPSLTINGAAIARSSMIVVGFIYTFYELKQQIKVEVNWKSMIKTFTASLVMAVPLVLFDMFYSGKIIMNAALSVSIEITFGILIYGIVMFLFKAFDGEDFELLQKMMPKPLVQILDHLKGFF